MISVERVTQCNKLDMLTDILIKIDNETVRGGTLIFVNENRTADFLATFISEMICPATSIRNDHFEWQVTIAVRSYESGKTPVIVGTSINANVSCAHIINYDLPIREEEYEQRVHRRNQMGTKPNVITFFQKSEKTIGEVFGRIVEACGSV